MRRTKEDAEKTKASILAAAEALFLKKGVSRTSLEEIARSAGLTRGAVYWHFKNKAHLITEFLGRVCLPLDQIIGQLDLLETNSVDRLHTMCSILINEMNFTEKRNTFVILLRRCEFTEEMAEVEQNTNQMVDDMISLFITLLSKPDCIERLRPGVTPALAAHMLHVVMVGMLSDWTRGRGDINVKYQPQNMINTLFQGFFIDWQPTNN